MVARSDLRTFAGAALPAVLLLALTACAAPSDNSPSPRPPTVRAQPLDLGPRVLLVGPDTPNLQKTLDDLYAAQEKNEFGAARWAVLFQPGTYRELHVKVGYYTQIAGLGASPDDVVFDEASTVQVFGGWNDNKSLTNFWRSAENFRFQNGGAFTFLWGVSQAAPLRRVDVDHDLHLFEVGPNGKGMYASGGFLADSRVGGTIRSGSQQQWLTRNTSAAGWDGLVWNMTFVGSPLAEPPSGDPVTIVAQTPVVREKPFLRLAADGAWQLAVPRTRKASAGPSWTGGADAPELRSSSRLYVALPETDNASSLNAALEAGKDLILTPGIYRLDEPLRVGRADAVVLGLGLATLQPTAGTAAIEVGDVKGVRLAGLLVDAGETKSPNLVRIGTPGTDLAQADDPTTLSDVFVRVGGAGAGAAGDGIVVNANDVIVDHTWIWRADHGSGVGWTTNPADRGFVVTGARVTAYGLFVEHFQKHQTDWSGEDGRTYFYQSELPYDPPSQAAWTGWASYRVAPAATRHEAWGLGMYGVFIQTGGVTIVADRAVEVPVTPLVRLNNVMCLTIDGTGSITHLVNDSGTVAASGNFSTYPRFAVWPLGAAPPPDTSAVLDVFNSSDRWNKLVSSGGGAVTLQGGIYNLEGNAWLYCFFNNPEADEGFTEAAGPDWTGRTDLKITLKGAAGGEQQFLAVTVDDGSPHRLSLAGYSTVGKALSTLTVPLAHFGADLSRVRSWSFGGRGSAVIVRLQKVSLQ